jgi:hypothetical protein
LWSIKEEKESGKEPEEKRRGQVLNLDVAVKQGEFENIECQKARLTPA